MDIIIAPARPQDTGKLTEITIAAKRHWNYPEQWMQLWLPLLTITPDYIASHETWMAVIKNEVVGYYSFDEKAEGLWLDNLWVLPAFMGHGIGKSLLGHALERARGSGASILMIEADPNARSFYEKMGAQKVGEHRGEVDGQPRILPVLEISL
jgi:predicted N-acetyltransferase YhbS